ncbi:MAG: DUF3168 domain-containing protein [Dehalococcoidales bacterium]|jgi:hypothetical protein|nr:DUF3168 domain-containing protein [Dehalococcoidales bacterium]
MLIEQALTTELIATTGITSLVGKRIYYLQAPQNVTKPYIVIEKLDSPEISTHDGPSGLASPRFSFSAYAATYSEAKTISAALKTALDGYNSTMGGTGGLAIDIPQRDDEWDNYDVELKLYEVISEYTIWYKE